MKLFKENKKFLTESNIKFINEIVLGQSFNYFFCYTKPDCKDLDYLFLVHVVLNRLENRHLKDVINTTPEIYDQTIDILNNFLLSVNEKAYFFTRIAYNLTFKTSIPRTQAHRDHTFKHKQIIIYLNDADKESKTCILDKKGKLIKEIVPEKFKGFCFDDNDHYHYFPNKGARVVLVATYI